jgi:hypothetical protein
MSWHPGQLFYDQEIFQLVMDGYASTNIILSPYYDWASTDVREVCNLIPSTSMPFRVTSTHPQRVIFARYSLQVKDLDTSSVTYSVAVGPFYNVLAISVLPERYCHLPDLQLNEPDRFAYFVHPLDNATNGIAEHRPTPLDKCALYPSMGITQ